MEKFNWLLTDEFVEFSKKIAKIHDEKKAKKQELKEFYEKIQIDFGILEAQAIEAEEAFEAWKKAKESDMEDAAPK